MQRQLIYRCDVLPIRKRVDHEPLYSRDGVERRSVGGWEPGARYSEEAGLNSTPQCIHTAPDQEREEDAAAHSARAGSVTTQPNGPVWTHIRLDDADIVVIAVCVVFCCLQGFGCSGPSFQCRVTGARPPPPLHLIEPVFCRYRCTLRT